MTDLDRRDLFAALESLEGAVVQDAVVVGDTAGAQTRRDDAAAGTTDRADQFRATIAWVGEEPLLRGRAYTIEIGGQTATATVAPVKYRLDLITGEHVPATAVARNEIGVADLELTEAVAFAPHSEDRQAGSFTLIDRLSGDTVGVGLIQFALRRASNIRWQPMTVDKAARAAHLGQRPTVIWLTGLSGAGKSTIANLVESELHRLGRHTYVLDGDNVRHGLSADLGFTAADRAENIRRIGEVARLMIDAGLIVIVAFISPFRAERSMTRSRFDPGEFIEVYVDAPLEVAEQRDPKGLYRKARRGELANFTGIDSPYEPPESAEVHLNTARLTAVECAQHVIAALIDSDRLLSPARQK